jgi:hypothetical protein
MTEEADNKPENKRDYEEGKLSCSLSFEIDGHKVSMTSGYDYETTDGLASMGWVWGHVVGEVLLSMRPHMAQDQWKDFMRGLADEMDEYQR